MRVSWKFDQHPRRHLFDRLQLTLPIKWIKNCLRRAASLGFHSRDIQRQRLPSMMLLQHQLLSYRLSHRTASFPVIGPCSIETLSTGGDKTHIIRRQIKSILAARQINSIDTMHNDQTVLRISCHDNITKKRFLATPQIVTEVLDTLIHSAFDESFTIERDLMADLKCEKTIDMLDSMRSRTIRNEIETKRNFTNDNNLLILFEIYSNYFWNECGLYACGDFRVKLTRRTWKKMEKVVLYVNQS